MVLFVGEYKRKLNKYRTQIPRQIRKVYPNLNELVLFEDEKEGCLVLCPYSSLNLYSKKVAQKAINPHINYQKVGLPAKKSKLVGIMSEDNVTFVCCGNYIEIWNTKKYEDIKRLKDI